jgi:predicted porin
MGTNIGPGDNTKVTYISPEFSGFKVGASYRPQASTGDSPAAIGGTAGTDLSQMEAVVAYNSTLGSTTVGADVAYWEVHGPAASSTKTWRTGLSLGFGAVTVGIGYADRDDLDSGVTANATESFDVGLTYKAGDVTIGTKYFNSSTPQTTAISGSDSVDKVSVGASYALGAGVTLVGTVAHVAWDDESTADANNNDGWAVVGGINVAF